MGKPVIAMIGAGSTVFARALLSDLFTFDELGESQIRLMDIDALRLADSEAVARKLRDQRGADSQITATTDRRAALDGADYVINMIQVGGYEPATVTDFEVAKRHGVEQTIGDTLGIGGIFRGLRTIPVVNSIALDMERHCPDALLINYTNPMAILMWALARESEIDAVGLCHSVQGTAREIAGFLELPPDEIDYTCAGINHMAFYLELEHAGRDLYPDLKSLQAANGYPAWERVRFTTLRDFGYFATESSEHFSEYVPWYIKAERPELIERFNILIDEYPARCIAQIAEWEELRTVLTGDDRAQENELLRPARLQSSQARKLAKQELEDPGRVPALRQAMLEERERKAAGHSGEYGTLIIHSMETGQPRVIYGNVPNQNLINNLPADCVVEVPCLVDRQGVQPTAVGAIPPQLASLMQTNINVQRMTVEASLTGSHDAIVQAALLDPHTAAVLDPDQIGALVDDLIVAHGDWLPSFT